MAKVKEAKSDPWKQLAGKAAVAEAPEVSNNWNTSKDRKPGDTLLGIVGDRKPCNTSYGPGEILEVKTHTGQDETVFLAKILQDAIAKAGGFVKGDKVFIKFHGTPPGKRYKTYSVGKL